MNTPDSPLKTLSYMIATEKIESLLFSMEHTLDFMLEYGIEADDEVKKAFEPILERFKMWIQK